MVTLLEITCSFIKYFPFEGRHHELYKQSSFTYIWEYYV